MRKKSANEWLRDKITNLHWKRQLRYNIKGLVRCADSSPSQASFIVARPQVAAAAIVDNNVIVVSRVIEDQNLLGCKRLPIKS